MHNHEQLDAALAQQKVALIHAVEGGFHLGDTAEHVRANVQELAACGVAYITVAHLFWRGVATNAPALPFLADGIYRLLFPQPAAGLSDLGVAAVEAMVAEHVLIDVTHMSAQAIADTLKVLDNLDRTRQVPVIASHSACRFGGLESSLTDPHIKAIADRGGVIGLIACRHYMADGGTKPLSFDESMGVICRHIDRIHDVTQSYDHAAFGSDSDGFIKPTLAGLETPAGFAAVEQRLVARYGSDAAGKICSGNAMRVLNYWQGAS